MITKCARTIDPSIIASNLDQISIELNEVTSLLLLYDEHWQHELDGVSPEKPYSVSVLIDRQDLGLTLLRVIEDKTAQIQKFSDSTTEMAYELARSLKASNTESEVEQE